MTDEEARRILIREMLAMADVFRSYAKWGIKHGDVEAVKISRMWEGHCRDLAKSARSGFAGGA